MNSITELLDLEDSEVIISNISIRGIKTRTINHPILQDHYELILILKQRRWRCTNPDCSYETNESFKFVNKSRRSTNATDMLIISAYRDLSASSVSIANRFHVSDSHVMDVFDRYVKLDRLPLSDIISVDEVHLDMDQSCKYALVLQDFYTGDPIDLLRSRRTNVTEPYFASIPVSERNNVKYLISDMYNPYLSFVNKYFPNAVPVVDSFHVIQWIVRSIDNYIRQLVKNIANGIVNWKKGFLRNNKNPFHFRYPTKCFSSRNTAGSFWPISQTSNIVPNRAWTLIFIVS